MANIAAGDVTYTIGKQSLLEDGRRMNKVTLAFGDGALTYPSGGIPITIGKLGCPTVVDGFKIMDKGTSGYSFSYDFANSKLLMFQAPAQTHAHDFLVKGGTAAAGTDALNIKSVIIGKEAATDATSLAADTATKGGVLSATLAAAAMAQASAVAVAAQSIIVEVIGW